MKSKWFGIMFFLILAGCGGGGSNSTSPPPTMNGTWTFTAKSTVFGLTVTGTGTILQTGNSLSGTLALVGSPCATSAALTGSANGTSLNFQIVETGQAVGFVGNATADFSSASGTYSAQAGGCTDGDSGTWTATKS